MLDWLRNYLMKGVTSTEETIDYAPDKWILGEGKQKTHKDYFTNTSNTKAKGVFMRLPHKKIYALQILKTKMGCETWDDFADYILLLEGGILWSIHFLQRERKRLRKDIR